MKNPALKTTLIVLLFTVVFSSCRKTPDAHFVLTQYEYSAGDLIQYENLSSDFETCEWSVVRPDGTLIGEPVIGRQPNILVNILSGDGVYYLKLRALSKKEKNITELEKEILVKSVKGYLTINSNGNGDHTEYTVYVDGQYAGEAGYSGIYQRKIPIGLRYVELVDGDEVKTELVEIQYSGSAHISF